jgi:hypothetical protein
MMTLSLCFDVYLGVMLDSLSFSIVFILKYQVTSK